MKLFAACILSAFLAIGCLTTMAIQQPSPAGCEDSWLYANQGTANLMLWAGVTGLHVMSVDRPAYYTLAHAAAQQASSVLRQKPVTLKDFSTNAYLTAFSPLLSLLPIDRVLCPWERDFLASYLEMV